jgi:hypothetical protein
MCYYSNLASPCLRHHQAKQTQGWRLTQISPGVFAWELPHGRRYLIAPDTYPGS